MNSFINIISGFSPITTALLFGVIIILVFIALTSSHTKYYFSPGPWGIPILGYYPFLPEFNQHILLAELSKKYGDVYLINVCGKVYVHLSSFKALREAFVTKSDCFAGRTQDACIFFEGQENGPFTINGEACRVWRKFVAQSIREFGLVTKEKLKHPMREAVEITLREMERNEGKPTNITSLLNEQCTEVIRKLIIGDNMTKEDIQKLNKAFEKLIVPAANLLSLLSGKVARFIASRKVEGIPAMNEAKTEMHRIFDNVLKDHETCLDLSDPKDITDLFLRERKLRSKEGDPQVKYFTNKAFADTMTQIYSDGGCTIGFILSGFIKVLARMPDVQESIFEEIAATVGTAALPQYEDRKKLPFTTSVIKELFRRFDAFPVIPSLECSEATTVSGVHVPKGSIVFLNLYAINHNPTVYKNPENFDPKRFLLRENSEEKKENGPMFFGVGKRACLGEPLAMTEVFLFVTAILQKFKLSFPEKGEKVGIGSSNCDEENNECCIVATSRV